MRLPVNGFTNGRRYDAIYYLFERIGSSPGYPNNRNMLTSSKYFNSRAAKFVENRRMEYRHIESVAQRGGHHRQQQSSQKRNGWTSLIILFGRLQDIIQNAIIAAFLLLWTAKWKDHFLPRAAIRQVDFLHAGNTAPGTCAEICFNDLQGTKEACNYANFIRTSFPTRACTEVEVDNLTNLAGTSGTIRFGKERIPASMVRFLSLKLA
jgi:hypothetical protein